MGKACRFVLRESGVKLYNAWDPVMAEVYRSEQMGELRRCLFEMMAAAREDDVKDGVPVQQRR